MLAWCRDWPMRRADIGHVGLNTTSRYAEITLRVKIEAMAVCSPTSYSKAKPWDVDASLLSWLTSL
jgi:integrase/recombinase XerD